MGRTEIGGENRRIMRLFVPKSGAVTEGRRKSHSNLSSSPNIIMDD
jgi:hypothetical protein